MATPVLAAAHLQGHLLNHKGTERSKVEAVKRPTVCSRNQPRLVYVLSRWEDYVKATNVKGEDQAIQLLECCDPDLRKAIQRNNGGVALPKKPLVDIMKAIKVLAVRVENPTVARDKLHNITQDREESVRAFGARLRGQAGTCQYTKACLCSLVVDYTEENVADALITGIADPEIKQGLLGNPTSHSPWREPCSTSSPRRQQRHPYRSWTQVPPWRRFVRAATRRQLEPGVHNPTATRTTRSVTSAGRRGTGSTPRSLYAAPNAPHSATPVGNVGKRTTPTECAGQSNP